MACNTQMRDLELVTAMRSNVSDTVLFPSDAVRMAFNHFAERWKRRPNKRDLEIATGLWEIMQQCSPTDADGNDALVDQIDTWIRG